jgi:hypothetical protein
MCEMGINAPPHGPVRMALDGLLSAPTSGPASALVECVRNASHRDILCALVGWGPVGFQLG